MLNFFLGLMTGLVVALINVILVYIFRAKIQSAIKSSPITEKGEILEMEDPIEHVKKMLS